MWPQKLIVPIFACSEVGKIERFLGTGVFVGQPPLLVTADHVVRDWGGRYAVIISTPSTHRLKHTELMLRKPEMDLAALEVSDYPLETGLQLGEDDEIVQNQIVACFEYSATRYVGDELKMEPATRLGHLTRLRDLRDMYGPAGTDALELSFPALRGSSGAPVLSNSDFHLWGIVMANLEYHLLPSQIVTVWDSADQPAEEVKYMLPQAVAVHVKHVRAMLQEIR